MVDDGKILMPKGNSFVEVSVERWQELKKTMEFHMDLAKEANAPSDFRFLNGLSPKRVGVSEVDPDNTGLRSLSKHLAGSCSGQTPLCQRIREVIADITAHKDMLLNDSKSCCVIIMTDGAASDGDMAEAMRPLAQLPCNVIVRLCTSEDSVVDYWDGVDNNLELQLDIIDDPVGEAQAVHEYNPWLNYAMPMHRMREFGTKMKELDMIDERALSAGQMMKVCKILFNATDDLPHPEADWLAFEKAVNTGLKTLENIYNPITKKVEPWVNMTELKRMYCKEAGCCVIS